MGKDYINIIKSDGQTEQMEVIATFKLEETSRDCIIYKSINDTNYYAASYDGSANYCNLDTNFNETETEQLNKIFETLNCGGEINA